MVGIKSRELIRLKVKFYDPRSLKNPHRLFIFNIRQSDGAYTYSASADTFRGIKHLQDSINADIGFDFETLS